MVFTPEQKIKIVQFSYKAKSYVTVRRRFCHEFDLLSQDAPISKFIMIFVHHLDSTGTVHTAQHTRAVQQSPCPMLISIPCASLSTQVPKNLPPLTGVGTLWHSSCRCLFTPRGYYVREKLQLSNHNAQRACGWEFQLLWTVAVTFLGALRRLTRAHNRY